MKVIKSTNVFIQHENESRKDYERRINDALKNNQGKSRDDVYTTCLNTDSYCCTSICVLEEESEIRPTIKGFNNGYINQDNA